MKDNHKSALIVLQDTVRNELGMEILCVLSVACVNQRVEWKTFKNL